MLLQTFMCVLVNKYISVSLGCCTVCMIKHFLKIMAWIYFALTHRVCLFFFFQRVLSHQDDTALLKAYIVEWRKFFTQCDILPKPFCQLEITLMGKQGSNKKSNVEDSIVRKVSHFFPFFLYCSSRKRIIIRHLRVI